MTVRAKNDCRTVQLVFVERTEIPFPNSMVEEEEAVYTSQVYIERKAINMCVALILILNSFYKYYDTVLEYCEHLTAAVLLVIVVSLILTPILFLSYDENQDDNGSRPFIAIAVLVCGVIGGLIMVISFIFFCKYCFKKRQPLASTVQSSGTKRQDDNVDISKRKQSRQSVSGLLAAGNSAGGRRGYEVLTGGNAATQPVPTKMETYLQQPTSADNNNAADVAASSTALIGGSVSKKTELVQKKLTKLAEEQLLIVQTEIEEGEEDYDEDPTLAQVSDSNLVSTSPANQHADYHHLFVTVGARRHEKLERGEHQLKVVNEVRTASGVYDGRERSASTVPSRHHQHIQPGRRADVLAVPGEESRRRSFDDRFSTVQPSQRRRHPVGTDYYASEYDRKHSPGGDGLATLPLTVESDHHRVRRYPKPAASAVVPSPIGYQQSPHYPHRLPRSHQMIVDKTPPHQHPPVSASSSTGTTAIETTPKMYVRDHRNAVSYGAAEQDFSVSEKNMYARGHRLAFSFTDTGAERAMPPPPPPIIRREASPDRRSTDVESVSFSSVAEYQSLEKFCRECRAVFHSGQGPNTTTSSSSSDQHRRNGVHAAHLPRQRQVKSLDLIDQGRRSAVKQRQANSVDTACIACMNDAINRLTVFGGDDGGTRKMRTQPNKTTGPVTSAGQAPGLTRQLTMIESGTSCDDEAEPELMHLDDAQSEQIRHECKLLWNLRSMLEMDPQPEVAGEEEPKRMIIIPVDDEQDGAMAQQSVDTEATTSYTTSFESNTEPITVEDYLRSRPSGPYLEPPRMTVEAKRQKLRSLYARRQMQLQQQGASIESYESVDTVDSSSSGRPELLLTSTESNQDPAGAHGDRIGVPLMCVDQQQSSLSFDSSVGGDAEPQVVGVVSASRATGDYLAPSTTAHRRRIFDVPGNGADNGTETDCSKSDFLSGESFDDTGGHTAPLPPPPPPPYPNVHLVRMRRRYEGGMGGPSGHRFPPAPPPPQARDYCIDQKTEAIFREFMRFDPKLESPNGKNNGRRQQARRYQYYQRGGGASYENDSAASSGGGQGGKLTQENSIDEEQHTFANRYEIPVIRLPDDDGTPSQRQSQPHQIGTAMTAKG